MNADIFIGIDMGSTGLKAVAFEAGSGRALAVAGGALPFLQLPGGGCELDEMAIEAALLDALTRVAAQLGPRVRDVRALACTGHGAGLYALDRRGRLLRGRAVASTDQRAGGRARALGLRHGAELFDEVGCAPWPGQPTLVAAELFGADAVQRGEVHRLLFAKDYLTFLLTGEAVTDASDVSTAGLLCLATGAPSRKAFEAAGLADLAASTLPPIRPAGTLAGRLLGERAAQCRLPAGLPVAVGTIDLLASLAAVGADARGQAVAILGTWCVNAVVGPVQRPHPGVGAIVNFGDRQRRLYLDNSPSSMANVVWLARTLKMPSAAAVVEAAMTVPLGAEGLRFLPFINGGGAPKGASAGFIGLQGQHGPAHMARAVVDAVTALHAHHLGRLAACGLGLPGRVSALGGGARDRRVVQLIAGFLGHPVERCGNDETGARGAALLAAKSQGGHAALPAPSEFVEPPADARAHADFYAGFHELLGSLSPAFVHMAESGR